MPMDRYPAPVPPTNASIAKTREAIIPVRARVRDGQIVSLLDQAGNEMGLPVTATPSATGVAFQLGGATVLMPTLSDPLVREVTVSGEQQIYKHDGINYTKVTPAGSNFWAPQLANGVIICLTDYFFTGAVDLAVILPDGSIIPGEIVLSQVLIYGQSLALGSRGYLVDASGTVQVGVVLHPAPGKWGQYVLAFTDPGGTVAYPRVGNFYLAHAPLAEQYSGGVLGESAAWTLGNRRNDVVNAKSLRNQRVQVSVGGLGGTAYSGLAKGTAPYTQIVNSVSGAKALATAAGWKHWVPYILLVHGESQSSTSAATYQGYLNTWQSDFSTDILAITGQKRAIPLFISQMNRQQASTRGATLGQNLAAANNANIVMIGPKYQEQYFDDAHMLGAGYSHLGDFAERAMRHWDAGRKWQPLKPSSIQQAGNQITLKFNNSLTISDSVAGPVGPLAFDTSRIDNPGNYGFVGTDKAVTGVALGGDGQSVVLTFASAPRANALVEYAMQDALNLATMPSGRNTGSRGNLRDSDTRDQHTYDGLPMHNYAIAFSEYADVAGAADLAAVAGLVYWPQVDSRNGTANGFTDRKTGSSDLTNGFANPATRIFESGAGVGDYAYSINGATHPLVTALDTSGSFTVGIAGCPTTLASRGGLTIGSAGATNRWYITDTVNSTDGKLKMHFNGVESAYADYTGPVLVAEQQMVMVLVFDRTAGTATLRVTVPGSAPYVQTLSGVAALTLAADLCVGGNASTGSFDYRGMRLRAAMAFTGALSGANLTLLESVLAGYSARPA